MFIRRLWRVTVIFLNENGCVIVSVDEAVTILDVVPFGSTDYTFSKNNLSRGIQTICNGITSPVELQSCARLTVISFPSMAVPIVSFLPLWFVVEVSPCSWTVQHL